MRLIFTIIDLLVGEYCIFFPIRLCSLHLPTDLPSGHIVTRILNILEPCLPFDFHLHCLFTNLFHTERTSKPPMTCLSTLIKYYFRLCPDLPLSIIPSCVTSLILHRIIIYFASSMFSSIQKSAPQFSWH